MIPDYSVKLTMHGVEHEVGDRVVNFETKTGQLRPNAFGAVLDGSKGLLTLNNHDGAFNVANPASWVDIYPRVPIVIKADNKTLFTGVTNGIENLFPQKGEHRALATAVLLGPLEEIGIFHDEAFLLIEGKHNNTITADEALKALLRVVGFAGTVTTTDGQYVTLRVGQLNRANVFRNRRSRVPFRQALSFLAQTEVGKIYDNALGNFVFENRVYRRNSTGKTTFTFEPPFSKPMVQVNIRPLQDSVINTLRSRQDKDVYVAQEYVSSVSAISVNSVDGISWAGSSNNKYSDPVDFRLDFGEVRSDKEYVEAKVTFDMEVDTDRDYSFIDDVTARMEWSDSYYTPTITMSGSQSAVITVRYPPGKRVSLRVDNIKVNLFRESRGQLLVSEHQQSIAKFGVRSLYYPADFVANLIEVRSQLEDMVTRHSGYATGSLNLDMLRGAVIKSSLLYDYGLLDAKVSDIVTLTHPEMGFNNHRWWVDSVTHRAAYNKPHMVELELMDLRSTVQWDKLSAQIKDAAVLGY